MWKRPPPPGADDAGVPSADVMSQHALAHLAVFGGVPMSVDEHDADAARRSLEEALTRLRRRGKARPGLATYLGWLGRFDADALSMLATPSLVVATAMRLQVQALWGEAGEGQDGAGEVPEIVSTTPSDLVEAVVFGAWLHEGFDAAESALARHQSHDLENGVDDLP